MRRHWMVAALVGEVLAAAGGYVVGHSQGRSQGAAAAKKAAFEECDRELAETRQKMQIECDNEMWYERQRLGHE